MQHIRICVCINLYVQLECMYRNTHMKKGARKGGGGRGKAGDKGWFW